MRKEIFFSTEFDNERGLLLIGRHLGQRCLRLRGIGVPGDATIAIEPVQITQLHVNERRTRGVGGDLRHRTWRVGDLIAQATLHPGIETRGPG